MKTIKECTLAHLLAQTINTCAFKKENDRQMKIGDAYEIERGWVGQAYNYYKQVEQVCVCVKLLDDAILDKTKSCDHQTHPTT